MLDDYAVFAGETKAVDEFFKNKKAKIQKLPYLHKPSYVVKECWNFLEGQKDAR